MEELIDSIEDQPTLQVVPRPKRQVSELSVMGKVRENTTRICIVCDNEYQGDPQSLYDTDGCKSAAQRDRAGGHEVKPRGPSRFELAQRAIFQQSGLTPEQIVIAREIALQSNRLLTQFIQEGTRQGMWLEDLIQLLDGGAENSRMMANRLGLENYEIVIDQSLSMRERLRAWKEALGVSERELASASGLLFSTVHGALSNTARRSPHPYTLRKLAAGFGISSEHLKLGFVPKLVNKELFSDNLTQ